MGFSAAVIVTTPQKLAFIDVAKGIRMFARLNVRAPATQLAPRAPGSGTPSDKFQNGISTTWLSFRPASQSAVDSIVRVYAC